MRFRSIIGWVVFFSLLAVMAKALPSPRATFYFFQGKQHYSSGNYEAAVHSFQKSVDADPAFARGYVDLGSSFYALDRYTDAENAFKHAIAIQDDSCARCGLGMIYRLTGREADAETALRKSIELNAKDPCPYDQLGRMYYDAKNYPKAIEAFEQKNKLQRDAVTYHFLANSTYNLGKIEKSIPLYQHAVDLGPKSERAFVDLGRAYGVLGRYKEAATALERAIELKPDDLQAHSFLGVTRFMQNDRERAMQEYRLILKKDPDLAAGLLRGFDELSKEAHKLQDKRVGTPDLAK
jgi:tetratricopeptide (TPR) repeat protein